LAPNIDKQPREPIGVTSRLNRWLFQKFVSHRTWVIACFVVGGMTHSSPLRSPGRFVCSVTPRPLLAPMYVPRDGNRMDLCGDSRQNLYTTLIASGQLPSISTREIDAMPAPPSRGHSR